MTQIHEHDCARAGDLVAYIYGEAHEAEADDFTRHLAVCLTCRTEAAAFGIVREDFAVWRAAAPELTGAHAARFVAEHVAASSAGMNRDTPSAEPRYRSDSDAPRSLRQTWRALTELFRVTPRWAQACGVAATVALCTLAGASLGGFVAHTPDVTNGSANIAAMPPDPSANTRIAAPNESEIESRIDREVARRLAEREASNVVSNPQPTTTLTALHDSVARPRPATRRSPARLRRESTRPPAADFDAEAELPRLSDLLDGAE